MIRKQHDYIGFTLKKAALIRSVLPKWTQEDSKHSLIINIILLLYSFTDDL